MLGKVYFMGIITFQNYCVNLLKSPSSQTIIIFVRSIKFHLSSLIHLIDVRRANWQTSNVFFFLYNHFLFSNVKNENHFIQNINMNIIVIIRKFCFPNINVKFRFINN